jgi:hypothetical protein
MSNCNGCTQHLCEVYVDCDNKGIIFTDFIAPTSGTYTLKVKYLNIVFAKDFEFTAGEKMNFEMTGFNENFCYEMRIFKNYDLVEIDGITSYTFCTIKEV